MGIVAAVTLAILPVAGAVFACSYLIGSIPGSYIIVSRVTGEDITAHGTGNVGAMNVRRTTGSWGWFAVATVADGLKGLIPVVAVQWGLTALGYTEPDVRVVSAVAMIGAVAGHEWSLWLSIAKRRVVGGKGLATGGGALLAYDPRYFLVVLTVGLATIALTRYLMAGQVAATLALPIYALAAGQADWPLMTVLAGLVYARHHARFVGLLRGREPRLYVRDSQGPRG